METILPFLDKDSLALLRPKLQLARAKAGQFIVREGQRSPALFIIRSGTADLVRNNSGNYMSIATLAQGHAFGESAFIDALTASASARAGTDCELVVLSAQRITPMFDTSPELFSQFYRSLAFHLSRKLRLATGELGQLYEHARFGHLPSWEIL